MPSLKSHGPFTLIYYLFLADVVAVDTDVLVLREPQRHLFPQVVTEFYIKVTVSHLLYVDQPSGPGQKCYFRVS